MNADEKHEVAQHQEVDRSGSLPMENPPEPAKPVGNCRSLHQTGYDRKRRGDEDRDEIRE